MSSKLQTLSYEQCVVEPIPGVLRDGKHLIVARGGDISRFCLCCGRPRSGSPIRVHLWKSDLSSSGSASGGNSGIFAIIELIILLIQLLALVAEYFESRKRTVLFGLCEAHRQERKKLIWTTLLSSVGALLIFVGGMVRLCTRTGPASGPDFWLTIILGAVGAIGLMVLAFVMGKRIPGVKLFKEKGHQLWLSGAGDAFLLAQPVQAAGK